MGGKGGWERLEKKENNGKLDPATKKAKKPSAFVRKARASLPPFGRFAQPGRHRASQLLGTTPPVPKRLFIYDLFQRRARTSDRGYFHRLNTMSPVSVVLLHERDGGVMLLPRLQPVAKDSVAYASNSESSAERRGASPFEKARRQVFAGTCKK